MAVGSRDGDVERAEGLGDGLRRCLRRRVGLGLAVQAGRRRRTVGRHPVNRDFDNLCAGVMARQRNAAVASANA